MKNSSWRKDGVSMLLDERKDTVQERTRTMTQHNVDYRCVLLARLPMLKVAVLYLDELVPLDPVGSSNISEWNSHNGSAGGGGWKVQRSLAGLRDSHSKERSSYDWHLIQSGSEAN
jgi:hypothetical protein